MTRKKKKTVFVAPTDEEIHASPTIDWKTGVVQFELTVDREKNIVAQKYELVVDVTRNGETKRETNSMPVAFPKANMR